MEISVKVLRRCSAVLALAGLGAWAQSSTPAITSVVNGGSMATGPIAPGMEAIVLGTRLTHYQSHAAVSRCW
jgi:hypothetical protein